MISATSVFVAAALLAAPAPAAPPAAGGANAVSVKVVNPLPVARAVETISLVLADIARIAPGVEAKKSVVTERGDTPIESQLVDLNGDGKPDELVFQAAFAAGETKVFVVRPGDRRTAERDDFKAYGRFVRERHDDFAWENDRVAHRMYGPDLENWQAEPLTSSGVDVWVKRVRKLIVNDWYMVDDYHRDRGEGADLYSVGKTRGCGGLGIWAGDKLHVSRNFVASRVLANGPIRLIFELDYAAWDAGGRMVAETKRVTLDAGKLFNRFDSSFRLDGAGSDGAGGAAGKPAAGGKTATLTATLTVGAGIAKHEGGAAVFDKHGGWLRSWESMKQQNGNLGCALVAAPGSPADSKTTDLDTLLMLQAKGGAASYYVGSAWDRGGDVVDATAWTKAVQGFARELGSPPRVSLAPIKFAVPAPAAAAPEKTAAAPGVPALPTGGDAPWSVRMCDSVMAREPGPPQKWAYDTGLVLQGCMQVWAATKDKKYFDYVKQAVDALIDGEGVIKGYRMEDYNLDNVNMGKLLFPLIAADGVSAADKVRYRKAATTLRTQLKLQPRTLDGAFWHKLIYPRQMWLDGVYMASPFLATYANAFHEPGALDEVATQILLAEKHMRDPKTGLLFHGWDESHEQRWSNPKTGTSPQFWGRAMGWYAMGIVDVLEQMPKNHPKREAMVAVLRRLATAIAAVQDKKSGLWWQVLDAPARGKNYEEASASSMFVYALGKAVKAGWLDGKKFGPVAARGYKAIVDRMIETDASGHVILKSVCKVAGLGGTPYRDGSYDYYTSTEVVADDPKGVGAFILAGFVNG